MKMLKYVWVMIVLSISSLYSGGGASAFYLSSGDSKSFDIYLSSESLYLLTINSSADFSVYSDVSKYYVLEDFEGTYTAFFVGDGKSHELTIRSHTSGDYTVMLLEDDSPYIKKVDESGIFKLREHIPANTLVAAILISTTSGNEFAVVDPYDNIISTSIQHPTERMIQFAVFPTLVSGTYKYLIKISEPCEIIFSTPKLTAK